MWYTTPMSHLENFSTHSLHPAQSVHKETQDSRGRFQEALNSLFPEAKNSSEKRARLLTYLDTWKGAMNRETKRRLVQWVQNLKEGSALHTQESQEFIGYIAELGAYEAGWQTYLEESKRYAALEAAYERGRNVSVSSVDVTLSQEPITTVVEPSRVCTNQAKTVAEIQTVHTQGVPAVKPPRSRSSGEDGLRVGSADTAIIDTTERERNWHQLYKEALEKLKAYSESMPAAGSSRSSRDFFGKGKVAVQAFMLFITALMVAGPRGEQTHEAGDAVVEEAGPHELLAHVGSGQSTPERFTVGAQSTHGVIRFIPGTHYTNVAFRPKEQAQAEQQIREVLDRGMASWREQGVSPEALRAIVDHVDVSLTGSASFEGNKAGNVALVDHRLQTAHTLVRQVLAEQGIPGEAVSVHQENMGMQGSEAEAAQDLEHMGVQLHSHETWHSFLNQLAATERTEGMVGVRHQLSLHGGHRIDAARLDTFFETHFRAHRAVGMDIHVTYRPVTVMHDVPAPLVPTPLGKTFSNPITTVFNNDVYLPSAQVDPPPEQTSGQLRSESRTSTKHVFGDVVTDEGPTRFVTTSRLTSRPRPSLEGPRIPPLPPVPPVLPTFVYPRRGFSPSEPSPKGPAISRKPFQPGGKGGATYVRNV